MLLALELAEIVKSLGGKLEGNSSQVVSGVSSISTAEAGDAVFLNDSKLVSLVSSREPAVVITTANLSRKLKSSVNKIITEFPHLYFVRLIAMLDPTDEAEVSVISERATIGQQVELGDLIYIGPNVCVEDSVVIGHKVHIGAGSYIGRGAYIGIGSTIHANVTIYPGVKIGANSIVHSGAVLGGDGFGFLEDSSRKWIKVPQIGGLIVGDNVEIGANTTIDRGALDNTVIQNGVKLDNQIQIGHNCDIGEDTAVAGCVGIAGSVRIGKRCKIGGAAMITGHLEIVDDVTISAGSLVSKTIRVSGRYTGVYPLSEHAEWLSNAIQVRMLGRSAGSRKKPK
jgi:UDP-3-O-[3-hydroxymyristoyl] glucosamine N-acyltransferase